MISSRKNTLDDFSEESHEIEKKETKILNPTMKEVAKLVDNSIDDDETDILGKFKKDQAHNEENDIDDILERGKSLNFVHRMSIKKIELGRMRSKLISTSAKKDKYADEVNIDKARAEKMADKFFKKRLKHINLDKIRGNSEDNFQNRSLNGPYQDFEQFNKNFISRLERKNSPSPPIINNKKDNIEKTKINIESHQNKNINIDKDVKADNNRVIPIPKVKSDLISNSRSYTNLRENNTSNKLENKTTTKVENVNQIKKEKTSQNKEITRTENNRRNKIDNKPVNNNNNRPINNNYNKPVNKNENKSLNRNDNKNVNKNSMKVIELPDNKNRRNIINNSNVNINVEKYNKSPKTQTKISLSPQSNINNVQNTSRVVRNQIPINNINKINKNVNSPSSNQRGNINSRDNRKNYNNSPLQNDTKKNNNISTNIINNNNRRTKNEEVKIVNKGPVNTNTNNRRNNNNNSQINKREPQKEVKKIENKNQRLKEINVDNRSHKIQESNNTTNYKRRGDKNSNDKPVAKSPQTKKEVKSITTTVSPRRRGMK